MSSIDNCACPIIASNGSADCGLTVNRGAAKAAKSPADGHTLYIGNNATVGLNTLVYKSLPFDPLTELAPATLIVESHSVLVPETDHHRHHDLAVLPRPAAATSRAGDAAWREPRAGCRPGRPADSVVA